MYYDKESDPLYRTNYTNRAGVPVLELKVPMCCSKCEEKVRDELEDLEGVRDVVTDQYNQRVTVTGYVDPFRALKKVRKVKKKSDFFVDKLVSTRCTAVASAAGLITRPWSTARRGTRATHSSARAPSAGRRPTTITTIVIMVLAMASPAPTPSAGAWTGCHPTAGRYSSPTTTEDG